MRDRGEEERTVVVLFRGCIVTITSISRVIDGTCVTEIVLQRE
jgi:hypothetical protein